jgi:hypothetical protein
MGIKVIGDGLRVTLNSGDKLNKFTVSFSITNKKIEAVCTPVNGEPYVEEIESLYIDSRFYVLVSRGTLSSTQLFIRLEDDTLEPLRLIQDIYYSCEVGANPSLIVNMIPVPNLVSPKGEDNE